MDKIEELLSRGVDTIYPTREELEKVLRSDKKLKLYQGFDPTGIQMHIGHMVGLRKLAQFQKLGHQVIFLIGDGTGLAGDPSGKTRGREKFLSREELRKNATDYVKQAQKIVSFEGDNPVEILFNGDWLTKLTLVDILEIAGNFTWQQLSERDMFEDRAKKGEPINMREFLYPLLQGYDSVAMKVDLEIGGTDQTFNMLCGRTLVQNMLSKNKFVLTTPLLTDATGRKIGKTEGNVIALNDKPEDLFGKIMALSDDVIVKGLEYLTDVPMDEIEKINEAITGGENPVKFKKQLAFEIVKQLNSDADARNAQEHFEKTVQQKELPDEVSVIELDPNDNLISYSDLLVKTGLASSKSEAKRLIEQGGVEVDNTRVENPNEEITITDELLLKVGKRKFVKVKVSS
ncbi:MAG TPA: tyrosine--tRNA ligase [Candidatus Saccharimonadales bacterium]|nr:tyrosine--tRNA ligase [Candidatus Saccharimonadales bacterium]